MDLAIPQSMLDESETQYLQGLRNNILYGDGRYRNSIVEWTLSEKWKRIPGFMHVRGECVERYLDTRSDAKIVRFVVNGCVSGEITCKM